MDKTDNLVSDQDLLDILNNSSSGSQSDVEKAMNSSQDALDKEEADKKMAELHDIANQLTSSTSGNNPGSGDIDADLSNWFDGADNLPSDGLNGYVSNSQAKMDYGLTRNVLTSYSLMGRLRKFIEVDAFDALFSEQAILGLDADELENRVKTAFTMYERLASLNAKINNDIKNYRLRSGNESSDVDKLTLLLGSISSSKLQSILSEIAYNKKEDKKEDKI